ncbi:MAG: oxygen-independent coproporphyrinogen III oxidase [Rhodospirillaceae bacterium]|nr:oxygen-independent coproporphyrinogen III oxidase [Rhodospirillaceae bacterium]
MDKTSYLLSTYDIPVPRYTSYPTAPHFTPHFGPGDFAREIAAIPADEASLYVHLPFCQSLCWYCGCSMKVARDIDAMAAYGDAVCHEIAMVSGLLGRRQKVSTVHFGGGTPTWGPRKSRAGIMRAIRESFDLNADAEIALEADPRTITDELASELADLGINRVSLGVQDFDADVQKAINRVQPFHMVERAVTALRRVGIDRINLDLMCGLPLQTTETIEKTVDLALQLAPQRIALFGYAHVPWMKKHQRLLERHPLPSAAERYGLFAAAQARIQARGFIQIGIDHFAAPTDDLTKASVQNALNRNFQGYTTDSSQVLLGFGASAISALSTAYAQNDADIETYKKRISNGALATSRGRLLTVEDLRRRALIMDLMCRYAVVVPPDIAEGAAAALEPLLRDGLCHWENGSVLRMTADGRPWVRVVAACFDAYYQPSAARHARAV